MSKIRRLFSLFVISFLPVTVWADSSQKVLPKAPDYSKKSSWLYLEKNPLKTTDVFYVHPTTYMDTSNGMNASLGNKKANAGLGVLLNVRQPLFKSPAIFMLPAIVRHQ